jgi:hypothetical protein
MPIVVLWAVTPCGLADEYQRFGRTQPDIKLHQIGVTAWN